MQQKETTAGNPPSTDQPKPRPAAHITSRFTDDDVLAARQNLPRALELAGLVDDDGSPICPVCHKGGPGRLKIFAEGGFQCRSQGWCNRGNQQAVSVLIDAGWSFPNAVAALLGRPHNHSAPAPSRTLTDSGVSGFKATVDSEVYTAVLRHGSIDDAIAFYGRWHISADAVKELGAAVLTDPEKMSRDLLREFGTDRLVQAGIVRPADDIRPAYWVFNANYPVLEPHHGLDGRIVGLQARASITREARIAKHAAYTAQKRAAEAAGKEFRAPNPDERFVSKFSSLRGGVPGVHLAGIGLSRLATLDVGTKVFIVEGAKDLLALRTMGFEGYALPGVGVQPSAEVLNVLARFDLRLAFDADSGGDEGTDRLVRAFARAGIIEQDLGKQWMTDNPDMSPVDTVRAALTDLGVEDLVYPLRRVEARIKHGLKCRRQRPPDGHDITDVLVARHATNGCTCTACTASR